MPAAITADCGATFRVVATDESGSTASVPATLTVTPAPGAPVIVTNPARQRLQPGQTGTFSVTAKSATPMSYQWQKATLTTNYVDIPGATEATLYAAAGDPARPSHTLSMRGDQCGRRCSQRGGDDVGPQFSQGRLTPAPERDFHQPGHPSSRASSKGART